MQQVQKDTEDNIVALTQELIKTYTLVVFCTVMYRRILPYAIKYSYVIIVFTSLKNKKSP